MNRCFLTHCLTLPIAMVMLFFLTRCNDNPEAPQNPKDQTVTGKILIDSLIDCSVSDVKVNCSDKIIINIPAGTVSSPVKLKVSELQSFPQNSSDPVVIHSAWDVTLDTFHTFTKPLLITIPYSESEITSKKFPGRIGAAWYIDSLKSWHIYPECTTDSINHTLTFPTNHLTKLGKYGLRNLEGYTDFSGSSHFTIYWTEGTVPSNSVYISPYASINVGKDPHYIQDMLFYLEQSYDTLSSKTLTLPNRVDVFVLDLGGDDGQASFLGYIQISNKIKTESGESMADALSSTCAHELMHVSQDYYYMQLFSKYTTKWWMEATAVLADRLVFPAKSKFEAENYTNGKLLSNIDKAWDDCNSDPEFYEAGGFLAYLNSYRTGTKLSVPSIVIKGGDATDISHMRTILDSYIKTDLAATGIGSEYLNYIKWALKQNGKIDIPLSPPSAKNTYKSVIVTILNDNKIVNQTISLPRLSAKLLKINSNVNGQNTIKIVIKDKGAPIDLTLFNSSATRTDSINCFKSSGDSIIVDIPSSSNWFDLLAVNTHKDDAQNVSINIKLMTKPAITSISPVEGKIGDVVTIKGSFLGTHQAGDTLFFGSVPVTTVQSWTESAITVKIPDGVSSGWISVKVDGMRSNQKQFTIHGVPAISSLDTHNSDTLFAGLSVIDITGTDFGSTKGKVYFGTVEAPVLYDQWGDKYIKIQVPYNGIEQQIVIENSLGQKSNPYNVKYMTAKEMWTTAKGFEVLIGGKVTFKRTDCNGTPDTSYVLSAGTSTYLLTCTSSPLSYSCTFTGQDYTGELSATLKYNDGITPKTSTMSGSCSRIHTYNRINPDGTHDKDVYSFSFANLTVYDTTNNQFGGFGPSSANFFTSMELTRYRWVESCKAQREEKGTYTFTDASYRGHGICLSTVR